MFKVVEMRKTELNHKIREKFTAKRGFGTARTGDPAYSNIWFVVPPKPPKEPPKQLPAAALKRAHLALNQLPELGTESELDQFVALLFRRREALTSSRMEGTWSTIDHVLTPKAELDDSNIKSATASVRGYAEALESNFGHVLEQGYKSFTAEFVSSLHKTILSKDPTFDGTPGAIRSVGEPRSVVFIGGIRPENSIYNPAPPEYVQRCYDEVLAWYRDQTLAEAGDLGIGGMTLPLRLAIGHVHFEAVHPFQDGNGRVGRMLWPFQMLLAGLSPLYLSGFVEAYRDDYGHALGQAQKKLEYSPIIEFICEAIAQSQAESDTTKTALISLVDSWKNHARFRKGSAAERLLVHLIRCPIMNAKEATKILDSSFQAASSALNSLVERRVVAERTGGARNRVFAAEEVLAIISRPFGQHPTEALKKARQIIDGGHDK